ncbi:MAG: orotidine 5'-phosphate decarboxylase / HUMPS family protein [Anaerolineaceae bacterium]
MNNSKPLLQIALDTLSFEDAFRILGNGLDETVDIIEVGTMLLLGEGLRAVDILRTIYPHKLLVADFKCIAPHFGTEILKHNPDFVTVLSGAEAQVPKLISEEALNRGKGQQVQIELYNQIPTPQDIHAWQQMGISHIIYSRPRSRKGPWGAEDRAEIEVLCELGMKVTATGGVAYEDLDILAGLPIFAVICGRSVRNAPEPAAEAIRIKQKIELLWK